MKIIDTFTHTNKTYRQTKFFAEREDHAAFGSAIELGECQREPSGQPDLDDQQRGRDGHGGHLGAAARRHVVPHLVVQREQRAQTRFEQQQQDRAARQQRQAQRDQERAADRQRKIQAEAEKRQRELEKPKKGGGGGKGKAPKPEKPAKQTPEEKRQASRDAVKQWMRDNDEGLAPAGFDGLLQFADGGKLSATVEQALRGMGLVEGDVGAPRLSAAAHVAVNAINSGNSRGAADAIRKAQERANAAAERAGRKKESYGGTPRGELPDSAFAGPGRSFPIKSARDVRNAIRALGRTKHDRDAVKRGIVRRARAIGATSALPETWKGSGLHVYKDAAGRDRWLTITTTAYEDRDGEIITVKGIAHAVTHGDRTGQRGPLRFWHVPGLDLGDCDFQAQGGPGGRWLIESGTFRGPREARIGQAMANATRSARSRARVFGASSPSTICRKVMIVNATIKARV